MTKVRKRNSIIIGAVALIALILIAFFAVNAKAEDTIVITYDANGSVFSDTGTSIKKQTLDDVLIYPTPDIVPYLVIPEKTEFVGWSMDKNDQDGGPYDLYSPSHDETLYAIWKKYDVQVTFDAGKGYFDENKEKHSVISLLKNEGREWSNYPSDPQWMNDEKVFDGWYLDSDCTTGLVEYPWDYDFKQDTVLYAKWSDAITITHDFNGGTSWEGKKKSSYLVAKGKEISILESYGEAPKSNQIISAWFDNKELKGLPLSDYTSFDEDITLYAKWVDTWNVTIDMGEGQTDGYVQSYLIERGKTDNLSVSIATNPLENGKYFAGIYTGPNGTGDLIAAYTEMAPIDDMNGGTMWDSCRFSFTPTKDTTLYAYWADPITVTFDANGGQLRYKDNSATYAQETLPGFQLKDTYLGAEKNGFVFIGWATDKDGKHIVDEESYVKNSTTLYAVWGDGFAVTYHANGGKFWDDTTMRTYSVGAGNAVDFNFPYVGEPAGKGKVFAAWYYDKECKNEVDDIHALVPDKDLTLYAGWSDGAKITYNANGGLFYIGDDENKQSTYEDYIVKGSSPFWFRPDEYPEGKEFAGYYYDQQLTRKVEANATFTEDTTLYAKWVDPVVLTFDANGGLFPWADSDKYIIRTIPNDPIASYEYENELVEKDGYVFAGWYLDKETTNPFNPEHSDIYLKENTTVYAKWIKGSPEIEVSYYIGNSRLENATAYVDENGRLSDLIVHHSISDWALNEFGIDPTKQGVDLNWYLDKDLSQPFTNTKVDSKKLKVYGKIVDRHKVTFHVDGGSVSTWLNKSEDNVCYVNNGTKFADITEDLVVYRDKPGLIHDNWTTDKSGKQTIDPAGTLTRDVDLYEITEPGYVVTFDANSGFWDFGTFWGGYATYIVVRKGDTLAKGDPEHPYYLDTNDIVSGNSHLERYGDKVFKGWYEDKAFTKKVEKLADYKPSSDITLYAKWERYGEETPATPDKPVTPDEPAKPDEPSKPDDTKPTPAPAVKNGVVKGDDGKWALYKDDKVNTSYTGIAKNEYGWWRIVEGYVDFNATGIYKNEFGWWRVEDGKVDFEADGIYRNEYGWWKTTDGKVTFDETGVFKNEYGWWRVEDSKVDFSADGIYKNEYGWWKTTDGKVTFVEDGVFKNEYGWWKVDDSKVDFKFTGIAKNKYGTWYVKNGKVDFNKNGKVKFEGKTYTVKNGKVQ